MKTQNFYKNHLPHINFPGAIQFVTFRLIDSLPAKLINANVKIRELSLDQCYGSCILKYPNLAAIIEAELLKYAGIDYILHAYVIMPNHVHVMITVISKKYLWQITKQWKGNSAFKINQLREKNGSIWQKESFDHYIRDNFYFLKTKRYIELNPVKAGLCNKPEQWRFSSAYKQFSN